MLLVSVIGASYTARQTGIQSTHHMMKSSLAKFWNSNSSNRYYMLTRQFANKPSRRQSSNGLVNSQTSQLADSNFFKSWKNYTIYVQ